jgi:hypothetical protein
VRDDSRGGSEPASTGGEGTTEPNGGAPPAASGGHAGGSDLPAGAGGTSNSEGSAGAPAMSGPPERTLWFSEYIEGSGNLKALELAARSEQPTAGCRIEVFTNGESDSPTSWSLDTPIAPSTPLVVCTKELQEILGELCLRIALNFNGDDAVVLRCDGIVVDAIGQVGVKPDPQWGDGDQRTLNMTLRRRCDISSGDPVATDAFDPAEEWQAVATDDFSGLGAHCDAASE